MLRWYGFDTREMLRWFRFGREMLVWFVLLGRRSDLVASLGRRNHTMSGLSSKCPREDAAAAQEASTCQTVTVSRVMTVRARIKNRIFLFVHGGGHASLRIRGNWRKIRRGLKYSDNLRKAAWDVWPCTQLDLMMEICKCEKAQRRTFPESGPSHQMWKILTVTKKIHRMFKIKCWLDL